MNHAHLILLRIPLEQEVNQEYDHEDGKETLYWVKQQASTSDLNSETKGDAEST